MLTIYRIDHISQVVPEIEPQAELLEGLFGFGRVREWRNDAEGVRGVLYELPGSRGQRWELLAPVGGTSPLEGFLGTPPRPGLHHIAVETNDMQAALAELQHLGLDPVPGRAAAGEAWVELPIAPPDAANRSGALRLRLYGPEAASVCGDERAAPFRKAPGASTAGRAEHTLGITELMHVCQVTATLDLQAEWNHRLFGMAPVYRTPEGKHPDMATMMLSTPGSQIIWELIAPVGHDSFVSRFLEKRGQGSPHHVTFEVEDWEAMTAACEHHGIPTFGESRGETEGAAWRDAFIHPKHAGGVLVQLYYEERPGVWMRSDKVPAERNATWT